MADVAENAARAARDDIAARTRVALGDIARGKNLLFLNDDSAAFVAASGVRPGARRNETRRVGDVLRPIIAHLPMRALRGVAADRQSRVDEQIEPIGCFFDLRAALRPDEAILRAAVSDALYLISDRR